jgi:hypothetical protein
MLNFGALINFVASHLSDLSESRFAGLVLLNVSRLKT